MTKKQISRPVIRVIGPSVAYVELTRGQYALIDADDIPLVKGRSWYALHGGSGRAAARIEGKVVMLHRLLLEPPEGVQVDHRNLNALDNRRANLRLASASENNRNRRRRSDNTSGFKGVHFSKKKWRAMIKPHGKTTHLGYFSTPEEAHQAYLAAAKHHYGEFARAA